MGIYDRPYLHDEEQGRGWAGGRSMVVNLIIANVAVWLAGIVFEGEIFEWLSLKSDLFRRPWEFYQLLTYGFVHDGVMHILFNMMFLFFLGREVENVYGRAEFLRIYLVSIVLAGLVWVLFTAFEVPPDAPAVRLVGASGGVMAIVILFVLNFPRQLLYIWGVLPVPAWALGVFFVVGDLLGFFNPNQNGVQVANIAHLAGAAFAFVYFRTRINLGRFVPSRLGEWKNAIIRPKLRIHDPDKEARDLNRQVDAILEKISREGEGSLTKKERKTLEEASRRYQQRKR
jgi:membrane associated rhomboid family serine protease